MKKLLPLVLVSACSGSADAPQVNQSPTDSAVLEQHAQQMMQLRPIRASRFGLTMSEVGAPFASLIGDYGPDGMALWRKTVAGMQNELSTLGNSDVDQLTLDVLGDAYRRYSGATDIPHGFINHLGRHRAYVINQIRHPLRWVTDSMTDYVAINSQTDARHYLRRLQALEPLSQQVRDKFVQDYEAGWMPPLVLREKALLWLQGYIAPVPLEHPLVTSLEERLAKANVEVEVAGPMVTEAARILQQTVYPAFQGVIDAVQGTMQQASAGDGLWALPEGDAFYRHAIYSEAGSRMDPADIHALGLREVERIIAEMDALLRSEGLIEGSVGERMNQLARRPDQLYPDSEEGRAQLLDDLNLLVAEINEQLPTQFGVLPEQTVEIRAFPVLVQDSAPGGTYSRPALDGSRPGIFHINLRNMEERARFSLNMLTYHETSPGHHLQIAIATNQGSQPLLRRTLSISEFSEGWALYSEQLAAEMGVYDEDPFGDLGRLQAELWRSIRLVLDTGLHHQRWSREKAIEYGMRMSGRPEISVTAEVERYMAWPGQALAYKLGMLEILDMRKEARTALGDEFDPRSFHDLITTGGSMELPRLRQRVQAWIAAGG